MTSGANGVRGTRSAGGAPASGDGLDDSLGKDVNLLDGDERHAHDRLADAGEREMGGHRQPDVARSTPDRLSDKPDSVPEGQLAGAEDRDRLVAQPRIPGGGRLEEARHIVDGHRADGSLVHADEAEDRERVERVTQVIQHVVTPTVDDARLEDRVRDSAVANEGFGRPLRAVVRGRAVRAGAQEAQDADVADSDRLRRLDERLRSADVHGVVGLPRRSPG